MKQHLTKLTGICCKGTVHLQNKKDQLQITLMQFPLNICEPNSQSYIL